MLSGFELRLSPQAHVCACAALKARAEFSENPLTDAARPNGASRRPPTAIQDSNHRERAALASCAGSEISTHHFLFTPPRIASAGAV
jgi:hypothetical protein